MDIFENVNVVMTANVYFDGKVTSRTIIFPSGEKKTLGIMLPGEYTFNTSTPEAMEILVGELTVQLPGSDEWQPIGSGMTFYVPADSVFHLRITKVTDYCCSFLA